MGDSERQPEKENGGGGSEGERDKETVGFARVWMCVLTAIGPPVWMWQRRWRRCRGVGGVGRRVDKGDSTLKPTKLQKQ